MARPLKPETAFAARLIEARLPMERDEFAHLLGVPKTTLGNWERGRAFPPEDMLRAIRQQTGVSLDWLIAGEGDIRSMQEVPVPQPEPELPPPVPPYDRSALTKLLLTALRQARGKKPADIADNVLDSYEALPHIKYSRNVLKALIELYLEQSAAMKIGLPPEQLTNILLDTYEQSLERLPAMLDGEVVQSA